jgi:tetraacyldisaccharide 4'-kinase
MMRPTAARILMRAWQTRTPLAIALLPLSWLYRSLVGIRRALYARGWLKQIRLAVPVIVVGNIFVGGTGKTPFVIWLVEALRERGYTPGVISRGYGAQVDRVIDVSTDSAPSEVGDEPLLIALKTGAPVVVGRQRVLAARRLLNRYPSVNVIISDDGLQHYALGRTVEIQLSDARGHGNGWLLPAGPLREPASRRSDFYVVNGFVPDALRSSGMTLAGDHAESVTDRSQRLPLSAIAKDARVVAAAGIGNPARFFDMLRANGVTLTREIALPDHFDFTLNPFANIAADLILITDKDAVKCARSDALANDARLWTVPVTASIAGPLADNIVEKLRGHTTA